MIKHSKRKERQLKYDFMPQLLEIIEKPAHIGGKVIIYGILLLLCGAVIWACLSKVDVVVTAPGTLNPKGDVVAVQAKTIGTVSKINFIEGDYVEKGQPIIELNSKGIDIEIDKLNSNKKHLQTQIDLYNDVLDDKDITKYSLSDYSEDEQSFVGAIISSEKTYRSALNSMYLEKESARLNLEQAKTKLKQYEDLDLDDQVRSQKLSIKQCENQISQIEVNISKLINSHKSEILQNVSSLETQLADVSVQISQYDTQQSEQEIISPINGYINQLSVKNNGDFVSQAQVVATIVPESESSEMNCYVQNTDIADINVGDEVEIKLNAYPYSKYGTVKGTIAYISRGAIVSEDMGSVYLIKVNVVNENNSIQLIPGLVGTVEIKTGTRSIMSYFLEPITESFKNSLKEK